MKKLWKLGALIAAMIAIVAFASVTITSAQETDSETDDAQTAPDAENGFGRGNRHGLGIFDREAMKEVVADALGITVEELEAAKEDGTRLSELAEELGVPIEDVEAAVEAARAEAVAQAVEDGTITQEQADQILSGEFCNKGNRGNRGNGPRGNGFNAPVPEGTDA